MLKLDLSPNGKAGNGSTRGHPSHVNYVKGKRKPRPHRPRRSARRHFHNGERLAAVRAFTGAQLYLDGTFPSLNAAAVACGSCVAYVKAAVVVLTSESTSVKYRVLDGHLGLLQAARDIGNLAHLVRAFRKSTPRDRILFTEIIGPDVVFDTVIAPAI